MTKRTRRHGTPVFRQSHTARGAWGLPISHVPGGSHMGVSMGPRFRNRAGHLDLSGQSRTRKGFPGGVLAAGALMMGLFALAA